MVKADARTAITIMEFASGREPGDPKRIGNVRNGFGMVTAKVLCKEGDPMLWVRDALADELTAAGFEVVKGGDADPLNADVVINGSVNKFYVDMYLTYRCHMEARFTVRRGDAIVLDREFTAGEAETAWWASEGEYASVVKATLQELMKEAVPDITASIQ